MNEMAASEVWGGAGKRIREAVKVFNYKVAAAGRPSSVWPKVWSTHSPAQTRLIPADCSPVGCGSTLPAAMGVGSNQEEPLLRNGNDLRELLPRSLSLFHVCFSLPLTQQKSCLSSASFSKGSPLDRVSRREI